MTKTAAGLIQDAFEMAQVYAPGETATDEDYARGFLVLNKMIDAWAEEKLFPQIITQITWNTISGTSAYTLGTSGAAIATNRPASLSMGMGQGTVTISGTTTFLNIVSAAEWAAVQAVSPTQTGTPDTVWYDPQYPNSVINITPTAAGSATVNGLYPLVSFAALSTAYLLAPGVEDALSRNLALALRPYFAVGPLAPELLVLAQETKNFLRYTSRTSRALLGRDRKAALPKQAVPGEGASA